MNYLSFIENKIVREKETLIHTLSQWRFKEEKMFSRMVVSIFCTGDISNISPKLPVLAKN